MCFCLCVSKERLLFHMQLHCHLSPWKIETPEVSMIGTIGELPRHIIHCHALAALIDEHKECD